MNGDTVVPPGKVQPPAPSGIRRERLLSRFTGAGSDRLAIVVGPAGSGKTTLLAQLAALVAPVGWYRAAPGDATERTLVDHLGRSCRGGSAVRGRGRRTVAELAAALDVTGPYTLLIDDAHHLRGTAAEDALARLVDYLPATVRVVVASRQLPGFDLSRWRLSGQLLELDADALRFRSWEAEQLFRDHYGQPLPPRDLATLTQRTGGWAAGLQLFHLATRHRPAGEMRTTLATLGGGVGLLNDYLARDVLSGVPPSLRRFLVRTAVLDVLNPDVCDQLLARSDSGALLEDLVTRQLFTSRLDDHPTYRYHEVIRSYLYGVLVREIGEAAVRAWAHRGGQLLERAGHVRAALRSYSLAGADRDVARLLGSDGERVADRPGEWIDVLPSALVDSDPWLLLARARQDVASGRWRRALDSYRDAEAGFADLTGSTACRRERAAVASLLDPTVPPPPGPWGRMVAGLRGHLPLGGRQPGSDRHEASVVGWSLLLAGEARRARLVAGSLLDGPLAEPTSVASARLLNALAAWLMGEALDTAAAVDASEILDGLGSRWLARAARALLALAGGDDVRWAGMMQTADDDDPLGPPLAALLGGVGRLPDGDAAAELLEQAAAGFRRIGTASLEAWARSAAAVALARSDDPSAPPAAVAAEAFARSAGNPGARLVAYLALAATEPSRAEEYREAARALGADLGMVVDGGPFDHASKGWGEATSRSVPARAPVVTLSCLGRFRLVVDGQAVDLSELRPRVRETLQLLAAYAGDSLHRERLLAALWPDDDLASGAKHLHVAVSLLRRVLERPAGAEVCTIRREADGYQLWLTDAATVDVVAFRRAIADARRVSASGDLPALEVTLSAALDSYGGDLVPEAGPAEWITAERETLRLQAAAAAERLAALLHARGALADARRVCERGLIIDRYRDGLWQRLIAVCEQGGHPAAAASARRSYSNVLVELGVAVPVAG